MSLNFGAHRKGVVCPGRRTTDSAAYITSATSVPVPPDGKHHEYLGDESFDYLIFPYPSPYISTGSSNATASFHSARSQSQTPSSTVEASESSPPPYESATPPANSSADSVTELLHRLGLRSQMMSHDGDAGAREQPHQMPPRGGRVAPQFIATESSTPLAFERYWRDLEQHFDTAGVTDL
ncbi:hypothetical protein FISHEDRAFT_73139 [Fistulina hepatica ATCC 64428]|uniref:Uncharacterized protein n=1 Tax=Fistulina hepatica ATCC 64428 TaxID=1128425 RepID=A0A0D7AD48_9AGAR|nr:hypothetical protein FISHEDRAFT_73139 [Fistulina hepatica ATCC 64428]